MSIAPIFQRPTERYSLYDSPHNDNNNNDNNKRSYNWPKIWITYIMEHFGVIVVEMSVVVIVVIPVAQGLESGYGWSILIMWVGCHVGHVGKMSYWSCG